MSITEHLEVPVEKLRRICDYESELKSFDACNETGPFENGIGQDRAVRSLHFGISIKASGYNIYVSGAQGTEKNAYTRAIIAQAALKGPIPDDWCYINNFDEPEKPMAVSLPAGHGRIFRNDMDELIEDLKIAIPKAFEGDAYAQQKDEIVQTAQKKMDQLIQISKQEAADANFNVHFVIPDFMLIPIKNGEPISREDYEKLPLDEQKEIDEKGKKLRKRLNDILHESQMLDNQVRDDLIELDQKTTAKAAALQIDKLKVKYGEYPRIVDYLDAVLINIEEKHEIFQITEQEENGMPFGFTERGAGLFAQYKVNLFVNNEKTKGAPVIFEPTPNYYNLFGKIEYESQVFLISTNLTMIKSGAIHKANGGYLILEINDVMNEPFSWNTLKNILKYGQAMMENIGEQYRLVPTVGLKPESIPLDVKIILIGTPYIFELLYEFDEDFRKLFKVKVDFDVEMPRTQENINMYASYITWLCNKEKLLSFDRTGLGKIIEYGSWAAQDQNKLTTRLSEISDIVFEAAEAAKISGAKYIQSEHVQQAIRDKKHRLDRIEEKIREDMRLRNIRIDTTGSQLGQINGISVIEIDGHTFGIPSRITARTYAGHDGVIDIERESEMSGNIHTKGVLTLVGYLGGKFGRKKQMSLTAQITFEQNYLGVEGDSASSTELYAILSSLSGIPLKQGIAVTGSIDQHGTVQSIGSVTHKIEGFFDLCNEKELTGEQGVIIPAQNISNLMLKDEVLNAVKAQMFHIYAVENVEEGIEILTGLPAGKIEKGGKYTKNSVFSMVEKKLQEFNKGLMPVSIDSANPR